MRPFFILGLAILAACGADHSTVKYGQTTTADLIALKGEPLKEEAIPVPENKILIYPENEKYQVKGDVVTHSYKNPKGERKSLIFWKHQFKECQTTLKKIDVPRHSHGPVEMILACPEQGISVIYTEGLSFVSRVVEYEKE